MQKAIAQHNSAGTAAKQHSQALQELSSVGQNLSGNLGTIGGILARMDRRDLRRLVSSVGWRWR